MSTQQPLTTDELRTLAQQLACPHGEQAEQIADVMMESNYNMIEHAFDHLQLQAGQHILEIGHGGAGHLTRLLARQPDLHYSGLEISQAMHQRAMRYHPMQAAFYLYDGNTLPDFPQPFARILTVNTLYFWQHPAQFLNALYDKLDNGGILVIGYGCKTFMETLPFCRYGFTLYSEEAVDQLIAQTPFILEAHEYASDNVISKSGEVVARKCCTTVLRKSA